MALTTRRSFLKQGAVAAGLWTLSQRSLAAVSVNEQINLGVIGLGWRGGQLLDTFQSLPGLQVAGICDPDSDLRDKNSARFPKAKAYADLRSLLDAPDIDAVAIATCNHWHCLAALWAMEAGKQVYVEKPLCNSHWEGQQVVRAARKHDAICQIGTQQRSAPMQAEIKRLLHEEKAIGAIQWVRVNRFGVRASIGKRDTPLMPPATLDYNLWLGPAADQPIYRDKIHYDWHWDWNTGAGEMGNWGVHLLDDVRNNVFQDRIAFPKRVLAAGGRFGWHDAGNTPNTHVAILDTGEIPVVIALTNLPAVPGGETAPECPAPSSGYIVYGEGGRLEGQRGRARLFDSAGKLIKDIPGTDGMGVHQQNFIDAVRNHSPGSLNAPVEVGHHSTAWCNLANYAYRVAQNATQSSVESWEELLASLQLGDAVTQQAQRLCEELQAVAAVHETEVSARNLHRGPVLSFDAASEAFVGEHAEAANQYLQTVGRGDFVVREVD